MLMMGMITMLTVLMVLMCIMYVPCAGSFTSLLESFRCFWGGHRYYLCFIDSKRAIYRNYLRNLPRVMGKVKGRVGLEPRVSLWHTHCGLREHQPCLSQCPDPLPAHSLSLLLDHFLGQRAKAVSSTVFGCGLPRCSQGLDLCTLAQAKPQFLP